MKSKYTVLELKYDDTLHHKYLPYVMVWKSDTLVPYLTGLTIRTIDPYADKNKILHVGAHDYNGPSVMLKVPRSCKKKLICILRKLNRRVMFK
jgi:hypothetical protein